MNEITKYIIVVFPNVEKMGYTLPNKYKVIKNARKKALETKAVYAPNGKVVIRKETSYKDCNIEINKPIEII